jgi:hypothetical protein
LGISFGLAFAFLGANIPGLGDGFCFFGLALHFSAVSAVTRRIIICHNDTPICTPD